MQIIYFPFNGPPNGVSNLFETKSRCSKKTSCVDGIYPVYTIYPTSNLLVVSPALPMAFQMAFQIYLKHILVFKKNTMCRRDLSRLHDISYIKIHWPYPPPSAV